MSDQTIIERTVSVTMRETRQTAAKLANQMADDMEKRGLESVSGPDALRAFAAALLAKLDAH